MENLVTEAFLLLNLLPLIHRVERWNILRGRREGRREGTITVPRTLISHLRTILLDEQQTLAVFAHDGANYAAWVIQGSMSQICAQPRSCAVLCKPALCGICGCRAVGGPRRGASWTNSFASYVGKRDKCQAGLGSAAVLCMALGLLPGVSSGLCSARTVSGRATVWISALEPWPRKMVQIMFNGCWSNIWLARIFVPDGLAKLPGLQTLIAVASGPEHTVVTP